MEGAPGKGTPTGTAAVAVPSSPSSTLSPVFWGVNLRPDYVLNATLVGDLESTPTQLVRWPGGGYTDRYDPLANGALGVIYNDDGSTTAPRFSTAQFLSLAQNLSLRVIFSLPAEINRTSQVRAEVVYVEQTLGFHPYMWEVGNEPALWWHFNKAWTSWSTKDNSWPTFGQYTRLVSNYVATVRAIDPTTPVIGLGGVGTSDTGETDWINATLAAPGVGAIAIHVYPDGPGYPGEGLTGFFAGLNTGAALPWRVPRDEQAIASACPGCGVSLLVTEYGAGTGTTLSSYMAGFPMVPFVSAEEVQAVAAGVPSLVYWVFQGAYPGAWFPPTYAPVSPVYGAFARVFPLLPSGNLSISGSTSPAQGAYALLGSNTSTLSLFAVNANATRTWGFNLSSAGLNVVAGPGTALTWNSSTTAPVLRAFTPHLPYLWTLPPDSVALLQVSQAPAPPPILSISASAFPTSGNPPLMVAFASGASGGSPPYTVAWTFGDGSPASHAWLPTHLYNASGTYVATAVVHDAKGSTVSRSFSVVVLSSTTTLLAHLTLSPLAGTVPLQVQMGGDGTGGRPPYLYNWSFGDLSPNDPDQNASHVYAAPGSYVVTLAVTDSAGKEAGTSGGVQVFPSMVVQILANRTSGSAPLLVGLSSITSGGDPPYGYTWDFGDGATASGRFQNHTFQRAGAYAVRVTAGDVAGDSASQSLTISVGAPPPPPLMVALQGPGQVPPGGNATFVASVQGGVTPYVYVWSFGDGSPALTTDTGAASHTFPAAGDFLVTVTVHDAGGGSTTASTSISVQASGWSLLTQPVLGIPFPLLMALLLAALIVPLWAVRRLRSRREEDGEEQR